MKKTQEIKGLKSRITILQGEVNTQNEEVKRKQQELDLKRNKITALQIELSKLENNTELKVSEHAILRYFERVMGIDINDIEAIILSKDILHFVDQLGTTGTYPHEDGFKVLMKEGTVTTIV